MYGLRITVYARGAGGIPTTTQIATDISGQVASVEYTIAALGGNESMTLPLKGGTPEEALYWINLLGCGVVATGRDGREAWSGYLNSVEVTLGQERRSISLDPMMNTVRAYYTTPAGNPGWYPIGSYLTDAASIAAYGTKYGILSTSQTVEADAQNYATRALGQWAFPRAQASSTISTGEMGESGITLQCVGWYYRMDWAVLASTSTTLTNTTTQLQSLITAYNAINTYYSTSYGGIVATGRSARETVAADTTYRGRFEDLLSVGNSADARLVGGVYEDRKFTVSVWAGETPSTIHYIRRISDGRVFTPAGAVVDFWNVRPDRNFQAVDLLDPGPVGGRVDLAAQMYIERVRFWANEEAMGVEFEPEASNSLDAMLARMSRGIGEVR